MISSVSRGQTLLFSNFQQEPTKYSTLSINPNLKNKKKQHTITIAMVRIRKSQQKHTTMSKSITAHKPSTYQLAKNLSNIFWAIDQHNPKTYRFHCLIHTLEQGFLINGPKRDQGPQHRSFLTVHHRNTTAIGFTSAAFVYDLPHNINSHNKQRPIFKTLLLNKPT